MSKTNIGWADKNWNPYTWNCNKVSPGCKHCYAEALAERNHQLFAGPPRWRETSINDYRQLRAGDAAFVNTMSDTFHEGVPLEMIERVFAHCRQKPDVQFLILTKRIERVYQIQTDLLWTRNIWLGTSVESRKYLGRIDTLRSIGTVVGGKFISFEPLLEDVGDVDLTGIDGVIVGGESGPDYRPFSLDWARNLRDQCAAQGVMFFLKQSGGLFPGTGRELDGREWNDLPWRVQKPIAPQQIGLFGG